MTQLSPMTTNTATLTTTKSSASNLNTPAFTSTDASPWTRPELSKNPSQTLEALKENQLAIKDLDEKNKRLRSAVEGHYHAGELAEFVDDENSQKFNHNGLSVRLIPGKATKQWSQEVQSEIDKLQKQIAKLEYEAERKHLYTETRGNSYWRVTLQK